MADPGESLTRKMTAPAEAERGRVGHEEVDLRRPVPGTRLRVSLPCRRVLLGEGRVGCSGATGGCGLRVGGDTAGGRERVVQAPACVVNAPAAWPSWSIGCSTSAVTKSANRGLSAPSARSTPWRPRASTAPTAPPPWPPARPRRTPGPGLLPQRPRRSGRPAHAGGPRTARRRGHRHRRLRRHRGRPVRPPPHPLNKYTGPAGTGAGFRRGGVTPAQPSPRRRRWYSPSAAALPRPRPGAGNP